MPDNDAYEIVNNIISSIESAQLIVMDFSFLTILRNSKLLEWIAGVISKNNTPLIVSPEFYRCYKILVKSESEEQKKIAENTKAFLTAIKEKGALKSNTAFKSTEALTTKLISNPDVLFMFSECSEVAEVVRNSQNPQAMVLLGRTDGKIKCIRADTFVSESDNRVFRYDGNNEIGIRTVPGLNEQVYDSLGAAITLTEVVSKGGEGTVYTTDNGDYVCKIYHAQRINKTKCEKLSYLESRQVRFEGICWPERIVYDSNRIPVGFLMKKASGKSMSDVFDGEESVTEFFGDIKRDFLVKICISLLEQYQYLHLLGIVIGDIRMNNIIIDKNGKTYLTDLDSCQIENFPCEVGDEDYTPAELQGREFATLLRTFYNERFAWAVICFNILFLGQHPYAQRNGLDTISEEIAQRTFKYPENSDGDYSLIPFGCYKDIWMATPVNVKRFFYDIFKENKRMPLSDVLLILDDYYSRLSRREMRDAPANNLLGLVPMEPEPDIGVTVPIYSGITAKNSSSGSVSVPSVDSVSVPSVDSTPKPKEKKKKKKKKNSGNSVPRTHRRTMSKTMRAALMVALTILAAFACFLIYYIISLYIY